MDLNQIKFRIGEKQSFVATRNFALGNFGVSVPKGAELLFDGSTVEFAGVEYSFPQLRGALKNDWIVPVRQYDETDPNYGRPERANIQVRHATQGGNPMAPQQRMSIATTESDEREVGNTRQHAQQTRQANQNYQRGNPVNPVAAGTTVRTQNGFEVVEDQDGEVVPGRSLKTAAGEKAKQSRTTLTAESAATALRKASDVQIEAGQGISEDEMLAKMTEEERETYLAQKEAHKAKYVNEPPAPRKVVGNVKSEKKAASEGISLKNDVGHGVEIADPVGSGGKPTETVYMEDGITFRNTNGPSTKAQQPQAHPRSEAVAAEKAAAMNETMDIRRQVAKAVCPDFPDNYVFDQSERKKLARLQADYEERPDVIRAVFAAETDDFKSLLISEFPQAFRR